jgi:putative PIN family toxin of toxin-antitoxin system
LIRAVLDANTIVSATISDLGPSGQIWQAAHERRFVLITSSWIISEVVRALNRDRIASKYQIRPDQVAQVRAYLEHQAMLVSITHEVLGVATHPEDDFVLATALSASAEYLITGDSKLQELGSYAGVTIRSPRQFLTVLQAESTQEGESTRP